MIGSIIMEINGQLVNIIMMVIIVSDEVIDIIIEMIGMPWLEKINSL